MNVRTRALVLASVATCSLAVAGVAHAAGHGRTLTTIAAATTVKPAVSATKTTVVNTSSTAAATPTTVVKTTAATAPSSRAVYRVQVGAAPTSKAATKLEQRAAGVATTTRFVVTLSRSRSTTTYRVVSSCHTLTDATALKATLAAKNITALVYRSQRC